jgi:hypothetical protein
MMRLSLPILLGLTGIAAAQPDPSSPPPPPPTTLTPTPMGGDATPAARIRFGGRLGINSATASGDDVEDAERRTGFAIGAFALIPAGPNLTIDVGASYSQRGATVEAGEDDGTIALDYIVAPVTAVYSFPAGPAFDVRVFGGGYLGLLLGAEVEAGGQSVDIKDETKSLDFGIVLGGGVSTPMGNGVALIDLRLDLGLSSVDDSDEEADVKNQVISINAGYAF